MRIGIGPGGNPWGPGETSKTLVDLVVHRLRCLPTKSSLLEHKTDATDATDATEAAEVVSRTAARSPSPHAPGARMTVVKQTPSNYLDGTLSLDRFMD